MSGPPGSSPYFTRNYATKKIGTTGTTLLPTREKINKQINKRRRVEFIIIILLIEY